MFCLYLYNNIFNICAIYIRVIIYTDVSRKFLCVLFNSKGKIWLSDEIGCCLRGSDCMLIILMWLFCELITKILTCVVVPNLLPLFHLFTSSEHEWMSTYPQTPPPPNFHPPLPSISNFSVRSFKEITYQIWSMVY